MASVFCDHPREWRTMNRQGDYQKAQSYRFGQLQMSHKVITALGIDPSSKTGFCHLEYDGGRDNAIEVGGFHEYSSKNKGVERLCDILQHTREMAGVNTTASTIIVIEGYSYASRYNTAMLAEIGAAIRIGLHQSHRSFVDLPPSSLKKFVTGKGNCKKELMLLNVYRKWGFEINNNNIADAFGLAMWGIYNRLGLISSTGMAKINEAKTAV